jgi:hypothetical protein
MSEVTGDVTLIEFADVKPGVPLSADRFATPAERSKSP